MPKPISESSKTNNRIAGLFFILASLGILGFITFVLISSDNVEFSFSIGFMIFISLCGLLMGILVCRVKNEETEEEKETRIKAQKEFESKLWKKWYIRAIAAAFMLFMSYISFHITSEGVNPHGLGLILFNPVTSWIYLILGILASWKLSLLAIALGVLFLIGKGITMLPINIVIILGAIIISFSIWKFSKRNLPKNGKTEE